MADDNFNPAADCDRDAAAYRHIASAASSDAGPHRDAHHACANLGDIHLHTNLNAIDDADTRRVVHTNCHIHAERNADRHTNAYWHCHADFDSNTIANKHIDAHTHGDIGALPRKHPFRRAQYRSA